jgi:hypothetical protein
MKMASPSSGIYSSGEVNLTSSPSIYFGPKGKTSATPLLPSKHKVQTILSTGSDRILVIAITSSTMAWACSSLACDNDLRADIVLLNHYT